MENVWAQGSVKVISLGFDTDIVGDINHVFFSQLHVALGLWKRGTAEKVMTSHGFYMLLKAKQGHLDPSPPPKEKTVNHADRPCMIGVLASPGSAAPCLTLRGEP